MLHYPFKKLTRVETVCNTEVLELVVVRDSFKSNINSSDPSVWIYFMNITQILQIISEDRRQVLQCFRSAWTHNFNTIDNVGCDFHRRDKNK